MSASMVLPLPLPLPLPLLLLLLPATGPEKLSESEDGTDPRTDAEEKDSVVVMASADEDRDWDWDWDWDWGEEGRPWACSSFSLASHSLAVLSRRRVVGKKRVGKSWVDCTYGVSLTCQNVVTLGHLQLRCDL